jgi:hypothetical protein
MRLGAVQMDSKWGWVSMVDRLSNSDITKHEQIYELNYIECLNVLAYWKEKDDYMNEMNNIKNNTIR